MIIFSRSFAKFSRIVVLTSVCCMLTACAGGGGGGAGGSPAASNMPRFAYVTNSNDNSVSIYTVNASTGQLRHNGYVATGNIPYSVSVDPSGRFAYVANLGGNSVSTYAINASTGALSRVGADVATGTAPYSVTVHPSGRFAYAASEASETVSAYRIDASSGALTQIDCGGGVGCYGANFATGSSPFPVTVDPSGKFAYVVNNGSNDISAYAINASSGALVRVNCGGGAGCNGANFAAATNPYGIAIDPTGRFVYITNTNTDSVSIYTINTSNGALTTISTGVVAGTFPVSITVDPTGKFAYVANQSSGDVSAYAINTSTGLLAQIGCGGGTGCVGANFAAGSAPVAVSVDASSKFVYVVNYGSNDISTFAIGTTGALTRLETMRSRNAATAIAMVKGTAAVTYTPKFAYAANLASNDVSAYNINAGSGTLSQIDCGGGAGCNGANFAAGSFPLSVTVGPSGQFAYVANAASSNVTLYAVNAVSGALASTGAIAAGTGSRSVGIDPSGRFAYVANASVDSISAYNVSATTGALAQIDCGGGVGCSGMNFTTGLLPVLVTIDPTGKYAYVPNVSSNSVSAFAIDPASGALAAIDCGGGVGCSGAHFAAGTAPVGVSVDASGKYAYVPNETSNDVTAYAINSASGALVQINCSGGSGCNGSNFAAGTGPSSMAIAPQGRFAYVANGNSNDVSAYAISPATGALTRIHCSGAGCNGVNFLVGTRPSSISIDASGRFAYVANNGGNVSAYAIDNVTGALTGIGTIAAGTGPSAVTTTGILQ